MVTAQDTDRISAESFGALHILGTGAQGTVFEVPGRWINGCWTVAYKEYTDEALGELDAAALHAMVRFITDLPGEKVEWICRRAAWPVWAVQRSGRISGFLMRRVPDEFTVRLQLPSRQVDKLGQVQLLLNDEAYLSARGLDVDDRFRLEFLRDTAQAMETLHRFGIVVGDLSPKNLLFTRAAQPRCFFIDCDAMRLHGASVLPQIETGDWEVPDPGREELATKATDSYKFALLCVRLFAGDQSTRETAGLQRAGDAVAALAARGLDGDPRRRPAMVDWWLTLEDALDAIDAPPKPATVRSRLGGTARRMRAGVAAAVRPQPHRPKPGSAGLKQGWAGLKQGWARLKQGWARPKQGWARPKLGAAVTAVTLAVVLLCAVPQLAAGGARLHHFGTGVLDAISASDQERAQAQAAAVAGLLAGSRGDPQQLASALAEAARCTGLRPAAEGFRRAAAARRSALARTRTLRTDRLPNGDDLKAELQAALRHSAAADDGYARWVEALHRSGCRSGTGQSGDRGAGDAESLLATAAKQRFVQLWAPIARQYGHPEPSYQDI